VNYALAIHDVQVAVFFREMADGRFRVSMRSKGEMNVASVAERFGGGGHTCASGLLGRWSPVRCGRTRPHPTASAAFHRIDFHGHFFSAQIASFAGARLIFIAYAGQQANWIDSRKVLVAGAKTA